MKKALILLASAALLFAGCAKEQIAVTESNGDTVKVTVSTRLMNEEQTKASWDNDGNGAKVDHWIMEVYDAQDKLYDKQEKTGQSGLTNSFDLVLIKGQSYKFAFWADKQGSYKTEKLTEVQTVSNVAGLDSRDAFFAKIDYTPAMGTAISAELYRPFAQINIVTHDLDKIYTQMSTAGTAGEYGKNIPTDLKLSCEAYTKFDVLTGTASGAQSTELTLASCYADFSAHAAMTTIFMDYLFATAEKALKDLTFSFKTNGAEVNYSFPSIPLQRNYRTNISGNLLSNDATVNVEIIPIWKTPEYEEEVWSAGMVTPVTPENDVYTINLPSELAWIAQQVNAGNTFEGKTVKLAKDIDLNNGEWTPAGGVSSYPSTAFCGTFDGQNYKILNLNCSDKTKEHASAALFGAVKNATIKNVTIENVKVSSTHYAAALVGYVADGIVTIQNCMVKNGTVTSTPEWLGTGYDNGDKVGGLLGYGANACAISGCIVEGLAIKAYRDLGGIAGAVKCAEIKNNIVKNCTITADQTVNFYGKKDYNVGAIVGRCLEGTVDESNSAENVTVNCALSDGLSFNPEAKELVVSNAKGLDAVRNFLTSDYCTNADYRLYDSYPTVLFSIKLMDDITLTGAWTPIATADNQSIHFDGNGKTICGLTVSGADYAGLFEGGRDKENEFDFKNLTIDGATVTGVNGKYAGAFMAYGGKVFHFENCALTNSSVTAAKYTAGFVGFGNAPFTGFKNLSVNACTITGAHDRATGGIIGHNQGEKDLVFDNVVVSNTTITSTVAGSVGGIIGRFGVAGDNTVLHYISCSVNGVATAEAFCGQRLDNGGVDIQ